MVGDLTNAVWFLLLSEQDVLQDIFEVPFPKSVPD